MIEPDLELAQRLGMSPAETERDHAAFVRKAVREAKRRKFRFKELKDHDGNVARVEVWRGPKRFDDSDLTPGLDILDAKAWALVRALRVWDARGQR